jgi:prolyl oligopeptidase
MSRPRYPDAPPTDVVEHLQGRDVSDPYRWLEDVESAATTEWSDGQDRLFDSVASDLDGRDRLRRRLGELLEAGVVGGPSWRGDRQFFMRRSADQEHAVLLTVDADGTERTLLDPVAIDPSGTTTLDAWQPSKEGHLLAYQLSAGGTEESDLFVMDVATGQPVEGPIDRTRYSPVAWVPGGGAFYYVRRLPPELIPDDEQQYHRRVWLHRVGTDPAQDVLVFGDGLDKTNYYGVSVSMDGRWLTIGASAGTAPRNDLWLADLSSSPLEQPAFRVVQQDVDASTSLHVGRDGRAYLFTDREAPRGRLAVATPDDPSYDTWTDLVPEDEEAVLEAYAILDGAELDQPVLLCA